MRSEEITYIALDSCFSQYAREIFEDYGIMMLYRNEEVFMNDYKNFIEKNCEYKSDMKLKVLDILSIKENESYLKEVLNTTSYDGELIENQIYDYMKLSVPESIIEGIISNSKSLSQSEEIADFNDKMDECMESLNEVEESVKKIYNKTEEIKEFSDNPKQVINDINDKIKRLSTINETENVENELYEEILKDCISLEESLSTLYEEIRDIITYTNTYLFNLSEAEKEITDIEKFIESNKGNYQNKVYESIKYEIEEVKDEIANVDNDIYGVVENNKIAIEQARIISKVKKNIEELNGIFNSYVDLKFSDIEDKESLIILMNDNILSAKKNISDFDNKVFNVIYENESTVESKNEIVDFVDDIKSKGIINYVIVGEISKKKVELEKLPSQNKKTDMNESWSSGEESIRKALVSQYIIDKFLFYSQELSGECLNYEVEYILKGNESDEKNISEVIEDIIWIREGFNLIYLLGDTEKKQEAYALAAAITGFTGMPVVIRITQGLILAAWAYAESVVDVRELLEGKRVEIIKNNEDWNLSLTGIKELNSNNDNSENRTGLLYEDYLRFFLFSQNKTIQIYRILDMIQLNVSKKYNNNFNIEECIVSVEIQTVYKMNSLFVDIGFIEEIINKKNKGYLININNSYSY